MDANKPNKLTQNAIWRRLRDLYLEPINEINWAMRSRSEIPVKCNKCGNTFTKSPYNIFYRSPDGPCPICSQDELKNNPMRGMKSKKSLQITKLTVGELLSSEDLDRLSMLYNFWKSSVSNIELCGIDSRDTDFKSESTLLKFLVETVINALHKDLGIEALIDKAALALLEIKDASNRELYIQAIQSTFSEHEELDELLELHDINREGLYFYIRGVAIKRSRLLLKKQQEKKYKFNKSREDFELDDFDLL